MVLDDRDNDWRVIVENVDGDNWRLDRIESRLAKIQSDLIAIANNHTCYMAGLESILRDILQILEQNRKDFKIDHQRTYQRIVQTAEYDGMCPCCDKVRLWYKGAPIMKCNVDHFNNLRWDNSYRNGWIICESCNRLKKDGGISQEHLDACFKRFHSVAREREMPLFAERVN